MAWSWKQTYRQQRRQQTDTTDLFIPWYILSLRSQGTFEARKHLKPGNTHVQCTRRAFHSDHDLDVKIKLDNELAAPISISSDTAILS